jgi:Ca2+-binding RTX toxin-like protein
VNNLITAGVQFGPAIAALTGGNYFTAWNRFPSDSVEGRVIDGSGTPLADEFRVNSTVVNDQFDPSIAGLNNGNAVVAFTDYSVDPGGDIRLRLFQPDGTALAADFPVNLSTLDQSHADVAALADGGFVVSWDANYGGGDVDVLAQMYNANGTVRGGLIDVDSALALNTHSPSVAGLANGNFVVAWTQAPAAGGDIEVWFERFNSSGASQGGNVLIDTAGMNFDIEVVGLQDGGFAVAYTHNESGNPNDIMARIYNANGSPRSEFLTVDTLDGYQSQPSLTVLDNGYLVVGWTADAAEALYHQAYTPDGTPVGSNEMVAGSTIEGEIAGLSGGLVANVCSSTLTDGSGSSIRSHITELIRTSTGNATSETLAGDALRDAMSGNDGSDTLSGAEGKDTLGGGTGNDLLGGGMHADTLNGGKGSDTLNGGKGSDTLNGGKGSDLMNGGENNDELYGGSGKDTLTGSGGSDEFVFNTALSATTNVDRIEDFAGNDLIVLDNAVFTGIGATLGAGEFRLGASAADANDRIIYNGATGALFFDADGAGGAAQVRFAVLDPGLALSNADFLLV